MANTLSITDNYNFTGAVTFKSAPTLPNNSIPSAAILSPIDAQKLGQWDHLIHSQTGTIVAATEYKHIVRGATATLLAVQAMITEAIATGADRTVSIDVQKSTGGGAFATMLTAPIVFNNASSLRTLSTAGLSVTSLVAGDVIRIVVTVAGAAGAQATGLICEIDAKEDPV